MKVSDPKKQKLMAQGKIMHASLKTILKFKTERGVKERDHVGLQDVS